MEVDETEHYRFLETLTKDFSTHSQKSTLSKKVSTKKAPS